MPDIAAADVTYTVRSERPDGHMRVNGHRRVRVRIQFGNGTLTYPSGGVPLTRASLGCPNVVTSFTGDDDASGIVWKYDYATDKLRGFAQGVTIGATGAAVLDDFPLSAGELATAGRSVSLDSAATGTVLFGRLKELVAGTSAPAAQDLEAVVMGW